MLFGESLKGGDTHTHTHTIAAVGGTARRAQGQADSLLGLFSSQGALLSLSLAAVYLAGGVMMRKKCVC